MPSSPENVTAFPATKPSPIDGNAQPSTATPLDKDFPTVDISTASSLPEINQILSALHARDVKVTSRLDALLATQKEFAHELAHLDLLRARLGVQTAAVIRSVGSERLDRLADGAGDGHHNDDYDAVDDGGSPHGKSGTRTLGGVAQKAERISSAVGVLDTCQTNVKRTLSIVEQISELKACVLGVAGTMEGPTGDWESAAGYLHRAAKIPKEILESPFAVKMVPTTGVPDVPSITLRNAAETLCQLFLQEFNSAVEANDGDRITRFFKLFPLIGHAEAGLDVYGRYVCQGVATRARANLNTNLNPSSRDDPFSYSTIITKLFEHVAHLIEAHGPLVERHYGQGKMIRVMQRLQQEADIQGGIIIDTWTEERNVDRRLTDIKAYPFSFLVQSFLPGASNMDRPATIGIEDEGVDMKEIDALLNEMTISLDRWSLYCRFLTNKCLTTEGENPVPPPFLVQSALWRKICDRMIGPYNAMMTFYLLRSVEKAFQLDEQPSGLVLKYDRPFAPLSEPPYISSVVDDLMYVVDKALRQAITTGQLAVVMNTVSTMSRVMGSEFIGMIQRKMRDEHYPRPISNGAPAESTVIAFLVLINNLDMATEYVQRLVATQFEEKFDGLDQFAHVFPIEADANSARRNLRAFATSFEAKATELINDGLVIVHNNVIKNHLRVILFDAFADADYRPLSTDDAYLHDEDDVSNGEVTALVSVARRFESDWMKLMFPLSRVLTPRSLDLLLETSLTALSRLLEKRIWGCHGRVNSLGSVRLERDVRRVVKIAISLGGRRWARSHSLGFERIFDRCIEIVRIMALEEEEWVALKRDENETGLTDEKEEKILTMDEKQRARAAVIDEDTAKRQATASSQEKSTYSDMGWWGDGIATL